MPSLGLALPQANFASVRRQDAIYWIHQSDPKEFEGRRRMRKCYFNSTIAGISKIKLSAGISKC